MSIITPFRSLSRQLYNQLGWFRVHLLAYVFIPILFSGFFIAANPFTASGKYVTSYIDAVFMTYSAMTVTGLNTVSVSALQPAQQAFIFVLMLIGDISVVNLVTIVCRQLWFRKHCKDIVNSAILRELHAQHKQDSSLQDAEKGRSEPGIQTSQGSGGSDETHGVEGGAKQDSADSRNKRKVLASNAQPDSASNTRQQLRQRHGARLRPSKDRPSDPHASIPHASSGSTRHSGRGGFPGLFQIASMSVNRTLPGRHASLSDLLHRYENEGIHSSHPLQALGKALEQPFKDHQDKGEYTQAQSARWLPPGVRGVVVGRNSQFFEEELDDQDLELIGALEYRATEVLATLLIVHQLFWMIIPAAIISIYFARIHYWDPLFVANGSSQAGSVPKTWFSFFQVVSAYTGCGLSLVDQLMVPFDNCYLLIYVLIFPMLAGNEALPLILRSEIWLMTKIVKKGTELDVSLHFLLTHSRRLFLYIFPTYISWWLFGVELLLYAIGALGFIIFNHGLPYYKSLGSGFDEFTIGLFQSFTVRANGFGIVSLSSIAPALNVLYLVLIFTCNYPLVMSIRSTNVYEERALGLHGEHAPGEKSKLSDGGELFSKYLKQHLLPQIYFDLWPVALATLVICIVERRQLLDQNNVGWLGVWQILFEVTSGYGTVGLSYNNPYNTSSLSATFRKISKLVMVLIMLRGRHRGLPLAIDRATMFPAEYLRSSKEAGMRLEKDRVREAGEEADQE